MWARVHNNSEAGDMHKQPLLPLMPWCLVHACMERLIGVAQQCVSADKSARATCFEFFSVCHPSLSCSQSVTTRTLVWSHHYLSRIRIGAALDIDAGFGSPVIYPSTFCDHCECSSSRMTFGKTSLYTLCAFRPIYPCVFLFCFFLKLPVGPQTFQKSKARFRDLSCVFPSTLGRMTY